MAALRDILRNHLKEKLARDEVAASMTVRLTRSIEIAQIAATAGFDTLYVDVEHNTLSIESTAQICIAAQALGRHATGARAGQHARLYLPPAGRRRDGGDRAACAHARRTRRGSSATPSSRRSASAAPAARCRTTSIAASRSRRRTPR